MNKTIAFPVLLFIAMAALPLLADKPVTIVTHYQSLPETFAGKMVDLTVRGGRWVAADRAAGCGDPLVDIEKGFIGFTCAGGGPAKRQFMSFLKSDGSVHVVVCMFNTGGAPGGRASSVGFYRETRNGEWSDITTRLLPGKTIGMFLKRNYDKKKWTATALASLERDVRYAYRINRGERTVKIKPVAGTRAKETVDLFRERALKWNASSGNFTLLP